MSHCAPVARKPVCLEFTPETAVGDILVAYVTYLLTYLLIKTNDDDDDDQVNHRASLTTLSGAGVVA